ncbi:MAG TPA: copper resistance CopC family protein [Amycolatopsis sp.]|nr:copper resistance CopC family protein [Amycolatopsis sp.]
MLSRFAGLVLATGVLLLAGAPAAEAHNVLESANPAKGSAVRSAPSSVDLVFNEPVESGFNQIEVVGPDKTSHWEAGPALVQGERVSVPLRPLGQAGVYTVTYHIVSEDGHPVSDSYTFTLTTPGTGTAAPQGAPPAEDATVPVWVWFAGGAVLLVAGVVVARRIAR